jgi:hypothetical protein
MDVRGYLRVHGSQQGFSTFILTTNRLVLDSTTTREEDRPTGTGENVPAPQRRRDVPLRAVRNPLQ